MASTMMPIVHRIAILTTKPMMSRTMPRMIIEVSRSAGVSRSRAGLLPEGVRAGGATRRTSADVLGPRGLGGFDTLTTEKSPVYSLALVRVLAYRVPHHA